MPGDVRRALLERHRQVDAILRLDQVVVIVEPEFDVHAENTRPRNDAATSPHAGDAPIVRAGLDPIERGTRDSTPGYGVLTSFDWL
jgi:hypothetical protein